MLQWSSEAFSEMQQRFEGMQQRIDGLKREMHEGFAQSRQRDQHLQRQIDTVVDDVAHIKKVVKRLPQQKDLVVLKKRVVVLERHVL